MEEPSSNPMDYASREERNSAIASAKNHLNEQSSQKRPLPVRRIDGVKVSEKVYQALRNPGLKD